MAQISRRGFASLVSVGAAGLSLAPLVNLFSGKAHAALGPGFGEPAPSYPTNMAELPLELQSIAFISLPPRFSYSVLSIRGQTMRDGGILPGNLDGMAAFPGPGSSTILVRNHELTASGNAVIAPDATYDPTVRGGTTTVLVDNRGRLIEQYASLAGTERNCAGGPTPWGSWLTCEESVATRAGVPHGYVFEVPAGGLGDPMPLEGLGRFNHEAAAVDPQTGFVYLTEDRLDSCFYRFRPAAPGDLRSPGALEALRLLDVPTGETRTGILGSLFVPMAVDWVPILDFNPATDTTRVEGRASGAAVFARGEGCWYGDGRIHFVCTSGGDLRRGQVFTYDPCAETLTLFVESTDASLLDAPDNLTVGPDGRLYLCEDGGGGNNIVGVDHDGELYIVASNLHSTSELAGACFSPNGRFMFVNIYGDGLTLAIEGPWRKGGS